MVGLTYQYTNGNQFSIHVQMLFSLVFLPIVDVVGAFEALEKVFRRAAISVLEYFEENLISTLLPGQQQRRTLIQGWLTNYPEQTTMQKGRYNKFANHVGATCSITSSITCSHGPLILYGIICHINRAMLMGRLFSIHFVALRWKGGGSRVKILIFWIFLPICPGFPHIYIICKPLCNVF